MRWVVGRSISNVTVEADECRVTEGGALVFESVTGDPRLTVRPMKLIKAFSPGAWFTVRPEGS